MIASDDGELILTVINTFTRENSALLDQLNSLLYWFRGAYTREDVFALTPVERERATEFLNKRFEEAGKFAKKGGTPFL